MWSDQTFSYLAEGASCRVDASPDFVRKTLKQPADVAQRYREWGKELGEQDWLSTVPGDSLASAALMQERNLGHAVDAWHLLAAETATVSVDRENGLIVQRRVRMMTTDDVPLVLEAVHALLDRGWLDKSMHLFDNVGIEDGEVRFVDTCDLISPQRAEVYERLRGPGWRDRTRAAYLEAIGAEVVARTRQARL